MSALENGYEGFNEATFSTRISPSNLIVARNSCMEEFFSSIEEKLSLIIKLFHLLNWEFCVEPKITSVNPAFTIQSHQQSDAISSGHEDEMEISSQSEDEEKLSSQSEGESEPSASLEDDEEFLETQWATNLQSLTVCVKKSEPVDHQLFASYYQWISGDDLSYLDDKGLTIVDYAALNGHRNVLETIKRDTSVDKDLKLKLFSEALCRCADRGLLPTCQFLVGLGADVNHRSTREKHDTPLESGARKNNAPIFDFFLSCPTIRLNANERALYLSRCYPSMTRALLSKGANPYPTISGKRILSAVHHTIKKALSTNKWSLIEPYVEWPGLRFDDYEDSQDILNPIIEKHLAFPQDSQLDHLLKNVFKHPNLKPKADSFILRALKQKIRFTEPVFNFRLEHILAPLPTGEEVKMPRLRRTCLYLLCQRGDTDVAKGLLKRYRFDVVSQKFHHVPEIEPEINECILDLLSRTGQDELIRAAESSVSSLSGESAAIHYAKGVIHYFKGQVDPNNFQTALDHFQKCSQTYRKSIEYIGKILSSDRSPVKDPLLGRFYLEFLSEAWTREMFEDQELAAKVITKLLYRTKRHSWTDDALCRLMRHLATAIDPQFGEMDRAGFEKWLRQYETETHDYYGQELSDDSDADEEEQFSKQSHFFSGTIEHHFVRLINKAEGKRFEKWLTEFEKNPQAVNLDKIREFFHQKERAPERRMAEAQIERDLHTLNLYAARGELAEGIASITTKFFIAQYRGISYETTQWNAERRRAHRSMDETDRPYYSAACYELAQESFHQELKDRNVEKLEASGKALKDSLLKLREEVPTETPKRKVAYGSRANQLQELYSRSKKGFMKELKKLNLGWFQNPFVSTGDTPFHALKYAYGIKPYEENKEDRLRPRWRKDGQAERPYSGKVYLFIDPIDDYDEDGPLHVPSLYFTGSITVPSIILNERESTFPAYVPGERVKYTYKAKYPSFKGEYKSIYLYKYGLKKSSYDKLRELFKKHPPHSDERRAVKAMLGEYLCAYHEVRLQDKAQEIVEKLGQKAGQPTAIIYRTELGGFSLTRPVYVYPNNAGKNPVHQVDAKSIKRRLDRRLSDPPKPHKKPRKE